MFWEQMDNWELQESMWLDQVLSTIFFVFVTPVPRFLQLYWRGYLEDSRSFNGDPRVRN